MANKKWVLAAVGSGTYMATLDASIVNVALPTLMHRFNIDLSQVKWIVVAYLLTLICCILPAGRISDIVGRKKIYILGYLVFSGFSVLCGLSNSFEGLILARMGQAFGAALLMANGPAIITSTFAPFERGGALGILAMIVSFGLLSGPVFGGFILANAAWNGIFLVNLPIGILGAMVIARVLENSDLPSARKNGFDWKGAVLQSLFLFFSVLFLDAPKDLLVSRLGLFGVAFCSGVAFFIVQSKVSEPLLDLALFKNKTFLAANLAGFFAFIAYSSVLVTGPFFLGEVLKTDPRTTGLVMAVIPFGVLLVAPFSGRLSDQISPQWLCLLGSIVCLVTLVFLSGALGIGLSPDLSPALVALFLCPIGVSMGFFQSPNNNLMMSEVPFEKLGVASALLALIRNLGIISGTSFATFLLSIKLSAADSFLNSIQFVYLSASVFSLAAAMATAVSLRRKGELEK